MRAPARLRPLVGRDVVVAFGVVTGLYALARVVPVRPLVVPGYLLLVGYDVVEGFVPALTDHYAVGFPLYLYALAALAAAVARRLRARGAPNAWRPGAAAALVVLGAVAIALAAGVYAPAVGGGARTTECAWTPAAIVAATGAALFALGGYLAGYRVRLVRERSERR